MENGFTNQLTNRVTPIPFTCRRIWPKAPKSTFTSMGMIMTQIRMPTGKLTWATDRLPMI
jgi:hypothetical protein